MVRNSEADSINFVQSNGNLSTVPKNQGDDGKVLCNETAFHLPERENPIYPEPFEGVPRECLTNHILVKTDKILSKKKIASLDEISEHPHSEDSD